MREDIQEQRRRWRADLQREQDGAMDRLRGQLLHQVQAVARRALADLASAGLEEQIMERFLARLDQLEPERRRVLLKALEQAGGGARLRTGFGLNADGRQRLRRRLAHCLPPLDAEALVFEQEPRLLCGVELRTATEVVGWNLDEYLAGLEQSLAAAVSGEPRDAFVRAGG
jgi:F-type H+-transporting ATPase subunit b